MDGTRPSASTNVRAFDGRMAGRSLPAAERDPERLDEHVRALAGQAQRRLDLEHVVPVAGRLADDPQLEEPLADRERLAIGWLERLPVSDELHALVEPHPVDGPHERMARRDTLKSHAQVCPDVARVRLEALVVDRAQDR